MKKNEIDPDHLPYCIDANDIAQLLGISRSMAYELMHREDFPCVELGARRLMVRSQDFLQWLDNHRRDTHNEEG